LREVEIFKSAMAVMDPSSDDVKPIRHREKITSQNAGLFGAVSGAVVVSSETRSVGEAQSPFKTV
jgi:hypothetical protein